VPEPAPLFVTSDPRITKWREGLAHLEYPSLAGEFIRYRDDPIDDTVAAIVREVAARGADAAAELRREMDQSSLETLRLFAMRRTLQGRRRGSLGAVGEAMSAFALLPTLEDVPWESWLKAALFVGRSLGAEVETVASNYRELAGGDGEARLDVAVDSMRRIEKLAQCHIVEVATTYGAGFLETLVFRGAATIGLFGAPNRLGDNVLTFVPTTNLAQLAVSVADGLDAAGVTTNPLAQDQLAATFFSLAVSGSYVATTGCLSCVADGAEDDPSFNVVVAELPEGANVDALTRAANDTDGQRALARGQQLIVLSEVPDFSGTEERAVDFGPFVGVVDAVLDGRPLRTTWPG
jgi:hypothetical protein